MERDIRDIIFEEKEERQIRVAEMEATKAQNMMQYEDEIGSRPKKNVVSDK